MLPYVYITLSQCNTCHVYSLTAIAGCFLYAISFEMDVCRHQRPFPAFSNQILFAKRYLPFIIAHKIPNTRLYTTISGDYSLMDMESYLILNNITRIPVSSYTSLFPHVNCIRISERLLIHLIKYIYYESNITILSICIVHTSNKVKHIFIKKYRFNFFYFSAIFTNKRYNNEYTCDREIQKIILK